MKIILQDRNFFVLRFDKGEEVLGGIAQFMSENQIGACAFSGIGACASMELGYFNQHLKAYRQKPFVEDLEIISLIGNGALASGQPVVHAHAMFGRTDFSVFGGHIFKLEVSVTCEIFLSKLEGSMERTLNPDFNLNLLV